MLTILLLQQSTRLRIPGENTDALKHVGVLAIYKLILL
jgi:hypothetical protein